MMTRIRGSVIALIVTWVASRLLLIGTLTGVVPYPDGPSVINDVKLYAEWSSLLVTGRFPIGDDMWQYPPGAGIVFALAALLGSNPVAAFAGIALACDLATMVVLAIAGRRRRVGLNAAWAWVIGALLVGPVWLARFDVVPTLAAVVALVLIARPMWSGAAAAAGTLLKVWPGIMLIALPRRSLPKGILGFVAMSAAILIAVLLWSTGGVSFLGEQGARGLQVESVGALPFMVWNVFTEVPTEFRFGAMEVDVAATIPLGLVITLAGFAVLGLLGVLRLLGRVARPVRCSPRRTPGERRDQPRALTAVLRVDRRSGRGDLPRSGEPRAQGRVAAGAVDPRDAGDLPLRLRQLPQRRLVGGAAAGDPGRSAARGHRDRARRDPASGL